VSRGLGGSVGAPQVVLVHGLTFTPASWDPVVEASTDLRWVRPALPGHDGGPVPPAVRCRLRDVIAAAVAALDHSGVERPLVVGHSFGALVAIGYAARRPVRGVVVVDQRLDLRGFAHAVAGRGDDLATAEGRASLAAWLEGAVALDALPPAARARVEATRRRDPALLAAYFRQVVEDPDAVVDGVAEDLAAVGAPLLAVHGEQPEAAYFRWLAAHAAAAEVEVWGDGGHCPHLAAPRAFAARLQALACGRGGDRAALGAWSS
jgi:2-succinyl-6-hydroxy-2,4-cyclohexadiene-1-carboxylate synthase